MKRHLRLTAIVTALYVLQSPVCALACLQAVDASAIQTAGTAGHGCHEEAPPAPSEAPSANEDCCDSPDEVVTSQSGSLLAPTFHAVVSGTSSYAPIVAHDPRELSKLREIDLPPPDILLLKSTLII